MFATISSVVFVVLVALWFRNRRPAYSAMASTDAQWSYLSNAYDARRQAIYSLVTSSSTLAPSDAARVFSALRAAKAQMNRTAYAEPVSVHAAMAAESDLWNLLEDVRHGAAGPAWREVDAAQTQVQAARKRWDNPMATSIRTQDNIGTVAVSP